jgi:hypothetical protein
VRNEWGRRITWKLTQGKPAAASRGEMFVGLYSIPYRSITVSASPDSVDPSSEFRFACS